MLKKLRASKCLKLLRVFRALILFFVHQAPPVSSHHENLQVPRKFQTLWCHKISDLFLNLLAIFSEHTVDALGCRCRDLLVLLFSQNGQKTQRRRASPNRNSFSIQLGFQGCPTHYPRHFVNEVTMTESSVSSSGQARGSGAGTKMLREGSAAFFTTSYLSPLLWSVASMEIVEPSPTSPLTSISQMVFITFFCIHHLIGLAPYICDNTKFEQLVTKDCV